MEQSHTYRAGRRPLMSAGTTTLRSPRNILLRAHLNTHYSGSMTTLVSPQYHICVINSRPETADNTVFEIHTLFKLPTVMQLTLSSSLSCPLATKAECPLWSSWIISWILMAPVGPYDLWSYALVVMVLQRREHTLKSDSLSNDLLLLYVHCVFYM